jgi:hypothetical protein
MILRVPFAGGGEAPFAQYPLSIAAPEGFAVRILGVDYFVESDHGSGGANAVYLAVVGKAYPASKTIFDQGDIASPNVIAAGNIADTSGPTASTQLNQARGQGSLVIIPDPVDAVALADTCSLVLGQPASVGTGTTFLGMAVIRFDLVRITQQMAAVIATQ